MRSLAHRLEIFWFEIAEVLRNPLQLEFEIRRGDWTLTGRRHSPSDPRLFLELCWCNKCTATSISYPVNKSEFFFELGSLVRRLEVQEGITASRTALFPDVSLFDSFQMTGNPHLYDRNELEGDFEPL